ncbi:MAG: phage head closure protein [Firmicutes bacterium]|nr:phage head closure protein [Bacillota bacterium]
MKPKAEVLKDLARVRRHRIIIQRKHDTFDKHQNPVECWRYWRTLPAERTELFGKEYYAAAAVGEEQTVVFYVRHVPFLDDLDSVKYRLLYGGKAYDIRQVDHPAGETWVKIRAIEKPGGGDWR